MKILHVTRDFPPRSAGGISTAVGGLVAATTRAGATCRIVSFDDWRPRLNAGDAAGAPIFETDDRSGADIARLSSPGQLPGARRFATDFGADVIHVHHGMLWRFAASVRDVAGGRTALTPHVVQAAQNRLRGVSEETASLRAQREAARATDAILAPSGAAARELADDVPDAPAARVLRLGVDDSPTARAAADKARSEKAPLLYAGRLADINGTVELFEVLAALLGERPNLDAVVAGGVPHNESAERRWHRRWAEIAGDSVRDRVVFTGWLPQPQLHNLMASARALVAPSWFETFGLTLAEAMLCGLPIASTSAGAIPELLDHGRTALLSPPRDVAAMIDNVGCLLDEPRKATRLGRAAAETARATCTWPALVGDWMSAYEDLTTPA